MKTILITAYAVNPYKGSEDGTGWNFIFEAARHNKIIAITRENNQEAIDKYIRENPFSHQENLQFEYFDLPKYARFWKKGGRGALLYFYLWQYFLPAFIKRKDLSFDIVHALNFHADWTPSFLWKLKKPFVWGPVGHHPQLPKDHVMKTAGTSAYLLDQLKWNTKRFFWNFDPFLRKTKKKADLILGINSSVKKVLGIGEEKFRLMPAVGAEPVEGDLSRDQQEFRILSIGRLVPLKGFDLALNAYADFYHTLPEERQKETSFTVIGKGPMKAQLLEMAKELKIESAFNLVDWMAKKDLEAYFKKAHLFFFTSHEGAGMVIPEALSFGLPVLCLDNIGPGELMDTDCGIRIAYEEYEKTRLELADQLHVLYSDQELRARLSKGAIDRFSKLFLWQKKGEMIRGFYDNLAPVS